MKGFAMKRRTLLFLTGSLAFESNASAAAPIRLTDAEAAEILRMDAEPEPLALERAKLTPYWFESTKVKPPTATWPADRYAYDYQHLSALPALAGSFQLTWPLLARYAELSNYALSESETLLFGLRGCTLASGKDSAAFADSHALVQADPDHVHPRCLIGVAKPAEKQVALFSASTVPCAEHMDKQIKNQGGCNLMPTGLHTYKVGPHTGIKQRGAFRQQQPLWVRRANSFPTYSLVVEGSNWDDMEGVLPWDNIHAAMLSYRTKPPYFSSAGCQVVVGAYRKGDLMPVGPWMEFRRAAGLADITPKPKDATTSDDGKPFRYMLLIGRELSVLSSGNESAIAAVRFGSSGKAVTNLQQFLVKQGHLTSGKTNGRFDRATFGALLAYQVAAKSPTTGILTVSQASKVGLVL